MLAELARREHNAGIKPDPKIDAFMKATAVQGQETNILIDLTLKVLGLDICADITIRDEMITGISGGQKKRVTTWEMLTGPARALFMDEISIAMDSSSTFQIVKFVRQLVHVMNETVMILPATTRDIILLSEGYIVHHGPRENILEFFESAGFRCPILSTCRAISDLNRDFTCTFKAQTLEEIVSLEVAHRKFLI